MELKRCNNCANGAWSCKESALPEVCLNCNFLSDGSPSEWKPKVVTNAYKIRAMTDEELADWISNFVYEIDSGEVAYSDDTDQWLFWLQQPAKEDA